MQRSSSSSGIHTPPSYAHSSLDRAPSPSNSMFSPDTTPKVPPPIYLRSSSPSGVSSAGTLKIHIPAWGVVFVRPPQMLELHPLEAGSQATEPPREDTVLSGSLEVIMKDRKRCQAISIGIQSVCKLWMGPARGWEEDGIFERGVEVLGGDAEGIWLEKGSQTFTFTLLLPATLATTDYHENARISYMLTARVEGIGATSHFGSIFRRGSEPPTIKDDIPFKEDFEAVIARSDKLAMEQQQDPRSRRGSASQNRSRGNSISGSGTPPRLASPRGVLQSLSPASTEYFEDASVSEGSAIAMGDGSPSLTGLYHRSQSSDIQRTTSRGDTRSILSFAGSDSGQKSEKQGWLKGDLQSSRAVAVHANPNNVDGVTVLDVRKEGFVHGLGSWRIGITSDSFSVSAVMLFSITIPSPSPKATIFFLRLLLNQSYTVISPRTPNDEPFIAEPARNFVLYQIGRPHKGGERCPPHTVEALWRGPEVTGDGPAGATASSSTAGPNSATIPATLGWRNRAVVRVPNHEKVRPSTYYGTITPIRVKHELAIQVFYSIQGESVAGMPIKGPGELRMMSYRMPVMVPSCTCTVAALSLPTCNNDDLSASEIDIDAPFSAPSTSKKCMCGASFAELGEAAMRKMNQQDREDLDADMNGFRISDGQDDSNGGLAGSFAMSREGSMKEDGERRSIAQTENRRGSANLGSNWGPSS
ncbi:hypothetical protein BD324DRAFT_577633 [Kockovaella imperatae]|uniref:Uncharacterized protein n=1 Tax=Kockovaella imperatae TaxID=4999 RepID=A0A1Y1UKJ7_9TREE|nr:hypothetical protein BD324DRAFT_577633 [Kockovaella imperatae]ORX38571.1 hypothetical protein BD324DRAFT_577633 [Kockovaella imperatae]